MNGIERISYLSTWIDVGDVVADIVLFSTGNGCAWLSNLLLVETRDWWVRLLLLPPLLGLADRPAFRVRLLYRWDLSYYCLYFGFDFCYVYCIGESKDNTGWMIERMMDHFSFETSLFHQDVDSRRI